LVKPHYRFIRIHIGRSALQDFIDSIAMPDWQAQGDLRGYCHWIREHILVPDGIEKALDRLVGANF
jgi:hypothetical protein